MDFRFNVNRLLPKKINKVTQSLIPEDFRGDRRQLNEYQRQLSRILDDMGEASARAQGLSKPITSATKLRDTNHIIYILVDNSANGGLGSVLGILKTGSKNLFLFDENGAHYQLQAKCVLDFYVHETKRRMGLGKQLYEYMLNEERVQPGKLAIDRPSEKFLQFLNTHYGLTGIIPQNNKFVVFQEFFNGELQDMGTTKSLASYSKPSSPSRNDHSTLHSALPRSAYGRYAAARPPCSMATIIHNSPPFGHVTERSGSATPSIDANKLERPRSLSLYSEDENKRPSGVMTPAPAQISEHILINNDESTSVEAEEHAPIIMKSVKNEKSVPITNPKPNATASQNYTSDRSEDNKPLSSIKPSPSCAQEISGNRTGHLDLKFYHSPLW